VLASTHASIVIASVSRPFWDVESYFDLALMIPETDVLPLVTSGPCLIVVVGVPEVSDIVTFSDVPIQTPIWGSFALIFARLQMFPTKQWVTIALFAAEP
jgi:hypothetical protein